MMRKFTFIIYFDDTDRVDISQHDARNLFDAREVWFGKRNEYSNHKVRQVIRKRLNDSDLFPTALEGMDSVWYDIFFIGKMILQVNIVETVDCFLSGRMGKFTLLLFYKGGIHVYQRYASNVFEAVLQCVSNDLTTKYFSQSDIEELQRQVYWNYKTGENLPIPMDSPVSSVWYKDYDIFGNRLQLKIVGTVEKPDEADD